MEQKVLLHWDLSLSLLFPSEGLKAPSLLRLLWQLLVEKVRLWTWIP